MDYGILYRLLVLLLVFSLCVAFSFGLVSSAMALDASSNVYPFNTFTITSYRDISGSSVSYDAGDWPNVYSLNLVQGNAKNIFSAAPFKPDPGKYYKAEFYLPTDFFYNSGFSYFFVYITFSIVAKVGLKFNFSTQTLELYDIGNDNYQQYVENFTYDMKELSDGYIVFSLTGKSLKNVRPNFHLGYSSSNDLGHKTLSYDSGYGPMTFFYPSSEAGSDDPIVDSVNLSVSSPAPYYPGAEVQLKADVSGTGILPGTPESTVYWYVRGNTSADTYINNDGLLTIANDETASSLEIEAISTYDSTKSDSVSVPVSYPLNLQITPSQTTLITSTKLQEVQFKLLQPNGQPFDYTLIEWSTPGADGQYFRIDDNGLLEILPGAPAGSVAVKYAYQHDTGNVSTTSAIVNITTQQEGIYDQLTPTPEQNDKADQMEDAIGNAADKLENNNSSLGQLTPTRPQINTNLELDQEQLLAVSPLVTNIWSINGLGRMISIVLVVATVAYIFFGKRDG